MGKRMSDSEDQHPAKKIKLDDISHPEGWTQTNHYGMCGQCCPCCRAELEDIPFGVCPICWKLYDKSPLPN